MKSVLILAFLSSFVFAAAQAQTVKADSDYQSPSFNRFLSQVDQQLPVNLKSMVESYEVSFFDSNSLPKDLCTEDVSLNEIVKVSVFKFRKRIYLHKYFWNFLKEGSTAGFACKNQSPQTLAAQALIYQVAKLYDNSEKLWDNAAAKAQIRQCETQHTERGKGDWTPNLATICEYYLEGEGKVSDSPSYKNLSDYKGKRIVSKNHLEDRIGNAHQLDSVEEHFALNLTKYLTDPTYQCRRPAFQTYFSNLLKAAPFSTSACKPLTHVFTSSASWKIDIAPSKVYQVHLLFASKGEETMSRWGHTMLRLIVCAPERTTVGPECLEDVAYHIVLSYRANINDVIINYWDGLTGAYPSELMTFSMPEMIDEYNRGQWRDLTSLPLKITEQQKKLLVQSALEHYWSYAGDYKFITNNCASEADQLLRSVLPDTHPYQDTTSMTPLGMYNRMVQTGLIDVGLLRNKEDAIQSGYFFASQKEALERAYAKISPQFPRYHSLEEWAHTSKASERRKVYETFDSFRLIGSGYILEKYVELTQNLKQQNRLTKLLQDKNDKTSLTPIIKGVVQTSQDRLPWRLTTGGYGVPLASETISDEAVTARWQTAVKWGIEYGKAILKMFPDIGDEMVGIKQNLELLTNRRQVTPPTPGAAPKP